MSTATAEPVLSRRSAIALLIAAAACLATSVIVGALMQPSLGWYASLAKPEFAPPNAALSPAWPILYAMMAVAAWLVWRVGGEGSDKKTALVWFGIQLLLNALWAFAFYFMQSPPFGLGVIMVLIVAIVITIVTFAKVSRAAALLLVPYLLWVGFAIGVNFGIWALNG